MEFDEVVQASPVERRSTPNALVKCDRRARASSTAFRSGSLIHLLEANILGVLMKALTAHVEAVLADQTVTVAAGPARAGTLAVFLGMRIPNVAETHLCFCFLPKFIRKTEKF